MYYRIKVNPDYEYQNSALKGLNDMSDREYSIVMAILQEKGYDNILSDLSEVKQIRILERIPWHLGLNEDFKVYEDQPVSVFENALSGKIKEIFSIKGIEDKADNPTTGDLLSSLPSETDDKDLFEDMDSLPDNVKSILSKYEMEDSDYKVLENLKSELEPVGYTFDYGLDASPYNLRKINPIGDISGHTEGTEEETTKKYLQDSLGSAKTALKYSEQEDKQYWKDKIEALKISLKYL